MKTTKMFIYGTIMVLAILALVSGKVQAGELGTDDFWLEYKKLEMRAEDNNIPFRMTYKEYIEALDESGFGTAEEYADAYLGILLPEETIMSTNSLGSSGGKPWYYNIGTSLPSNANPDYSRYNVYDMVEKGDIIYEANGGFRITGHIAIVEGKYYNAAKNVNYVRIIEAIDDGVVRSCLDDTRAKDKQVSILKLINRTDSVVNAAIDFCIGELGSSYWPDLRKDTSSSETDWYCSELVWAAYYNQGIDLDIQFGDLGVTPSDIRKSPLLQEVILY